ncbi:hypothetical protein [Halarcobacter bivalviorum]|uniref:Membrane protein n=1 Tax=Halarcobacter bivalviorum TaxID=663364 RepID=A0AAX2A8L0_9BACT|nr:hypothetical protein [Halarcobacter bivalviorum]AXH12489.1 putative membrane protein [Halarcobacter bivalviorum]RXK07937.1 hypothetical protein CRU97_00920 [Halarcobacter bivalviorum]RXK10587.1 hypothetical protein CRV05_04720 [Halarcobacter bivalviorum]
MKINNLDNPFYIFLFCIFALIINTISSIYFFPIMLLGILFIAFYICMEKNYNYTLFFLGFTILIIEINSGFKPFSIILLSFFIYAFIIPYVSRVLSVDGINLYVYLVIFYCGLLLLWLLNNDISFQLNFFLLINLVLDLIIFGIFI